VSLPNPIPDNPQRWDGWRQYNSENLYERLGLAFDSNPSPEQIEDNCRRLLVWWQKKLPLKNQPSNPVAQMLRAGLDEAPKFLAEARTLLLDNDARARIDFELHERIVAKALDEFKKLLSFAMAENKLRAEDEQRLYERGRTYGLGHDDMKNAIDAELTRLGGERIAMQVVAPLPPPPVAAPIVVAPTAASVLTSESRNPADEFRRMLRLSKLCLDGDDMTDDQRDAMCNMGESLGLTGGQAEDLIDEYLEACSNGPVTPAKVAVASARPAVAVKPVVAPASVKRAAPTPIPAVKVEVAPPKPAAKLSNAINTSPIARAGERLKYPAFKNGIDLEMLLITSGAFAMGSDSGEAGPHEQPVTPVTIGCFFMARFPVTNAQYERFDPTHVSKRAPWASEHHPVVYVSSRDAEKFCQWLSAREGRKYRLPTEAEWEYAARGTDHRIYPWGPRLDVGNLANFADQRTAFAWRDSAIDDGHAETAPVGSYPRGASPFGIEDLAGNVFEWCLDFFESYRGKERVNPTGPTQGTQRVYRGGSWKSRASNLRASARHYNQPDYFSNDVGFRVICECAG
jgi:formylglycine-generating enzyme required for sulfatase activity